MTKTQPSPPPWCRFVLRHYERHGMEIVANWTGHSDSCDEELTWKTFLLTINQNEDTLQRQWSQRQIASCWSAHCAFTPLSRHVHRKVSTHQLLLVHIKEEFNSTPILSYMWSHLLSTKRWRAECTTTQGTKRLLDLSLSLRWKKWSSCSHWNGLECPQLPAAIRCCHPISTQT